MTCTDSDHEIEGRHVRHMAADEIAMIDAGILGDPQQSARPRQFQVFGALGARQRVGMGYRPEWVLLADVADADPTQQQGDVPFQAREAVDGALVSR